MLTKSRKRNKVYLLILIILFFCLIVSCDNDGRIDIVEKMNNGLESEIIQIIYVDDIRNVYEITSAKHIEIWYYDVDLNDNGHKDIIAIVRSPLHSGSGGDSFDIWINNGNGEYHEVSDLSVVQILAEESKYNGEIYISDKKTNGFRNIIISNDKEINLIYEDGKYIVY